MGMGLAGGYGAAAAGDTIREVLKQKFIEAIQRQQMAQRIKEAEMQNALGHRRLDVDESQFGRKLGQDAEQFGQNLGLQRDKLGEDTRQFDVTAGQRQQGIDLDKEFQPVRIRQASAQAADVERRPQAEADARTHDQTMANLQGKIRSGHIAQEAGEERRTLGTRLAGAGGGPGRAQSTAERAEVYGQERSARILQSVDELDKQVSPWTTGPGSLLSNIPATDARNFKAALDSLKANVAFGELTEMRAASRTGGALGQVSNIELQLLESALGALDPGQSPAAFRGQLQKIKGSLERWNKAKAGAAGGGDAPAQGGNKVSITSITEIK
jgi:hypothetical protein